MKVQYSHLQCLLLTSYCLLLTVWGCGYKIQGKTSLPFNAIQMGIIENLTTEPKLQDKLYQALIEEFLRQGIAVYSDADYKLSGKIKRFELRILSEKRGVATEYEVIIKADFELKDPSGNIKEFKNIGSPFLVSFQSSDMLEDVVASKEIASEQAIRDMAMEIVAYFIYR